MKALTSADNALYKSIKALVASKGRREQGLFLAEGPHLAEEALRSRTQIRYIVTREDSSEKYADLIRQCERQGAEILTVSPKLFYALADTGTPQGILAVCGIRRYTPDDPVFTGARLAIVLDHLQDPGNMGTVLRTALAVGAGFAVVTGGCADPWSQKVVRASQGAVLHLPVIECDTAAGIVGVLNHAGWHTACGHLGGSDFFQRQAHGRTALVIGNEASGVGEATAAACSEKYKLPMPGKAESLNAAVAAGIMLYDLWREQNR